MQGIVLILALSVLVEAIVEYAKSISKMFTEKDYRTAITQFAALGITFAAPWIGTALTGLFASRGANFVSDLIKRIQKIKNPE